MSRELIHKFLSNFSGTTCYNTTEERSPYFKIASLSECISHNKRGKDVYYLVNSGGTEVESLTRFNSFFIDMDAGYADKEKTTYLPMSEVVVKKKEMMGRIESLGKKPHYIVETRNGYHVYWLIDHPANPENLSVWNSLQYSLCSFLQGDFNVLRPNQILRLPYTLWNKKWDNKEPFDVSIVVDNSDMEKYNMHHFIKNTDIGILVAPNNFSIAKSRFITFTASINNMNAANLSFWPHSGSPTAQQLTSLAKSVIRKQNITISNIIGTGPTNGT